MYVGLVPGAVVSGSPDTYGEGRPTLETTQEDRIILKPKLLLQPTYRKAGVNIKHILNSKIILTPSNMT